MWFTAETSGVLEMQNFTWLLTPFPLLELPASVRTGGRTQTSYPNFMGWIDYQVFLASFSYRAPLARAWSSAINIVKIWKYVFYIEVSGVYILELHWIDNTIFSLKNTRQARAWVLTFLISMNIRLWPYEVQHLSRSSLLHWTGRLWSPSRAKSNQSFIILTHLATNKLILQTDLHAFS